MHSSSSDEYSHVCCIYISLFVLKEYQRRTNKQTKNKTKQNKNLHVSLARSNYIVIKCRVGGGGAGQGVHNDDCMEETQAVF